MILAPRQLAAAYSALGENLPRGTTYTPPLSRPNSNKDFLLNCPRLSTAEQTLNSTLTRAPPLRLHHFLLILNCIQMYLSVDIHCGCCYHERGTRIKQAPASLDSQ